MFVDEKDYVEEKEKPEFILSLWFNELNFIFV